MTKYKNIQKFANFARLYFPYLTANFGVLLLLKGSFQEFPLLPGFA